MAFFGPKKTKEEKAHAQRNKQRLKELQQEAKAQKKRAAAAQKARQAQEKRVVKDAKRQEKLVAAQRKEERQQLKREEKREQKQLRVAQKEAKKTRRVTVRLARKATKAHQKTARLARKADKKRKRQRKKQLRRARRGAAAAGVAEVDLETTETVAPAEPPPFTKRSSCYVCGKGFQRALLRRRHHCRQCRESCCIQCVSRTRRPVPLHGLMKPQKVCVVCECLVFNNESADAQPRDPAVALAVLAASGQGRRAGTSTRRPSSAPLPPTAGVEVPPTSRSRRTRSAKSKGTSLWTLPIRPLLKRKKSAQQLRNRKMDLDLQLEKGALVTSRAIELQPQQLASMAS
ncbi:hypothetical protein BBJ28_00010971 [Nothophytophthora sp. Chile5]|nr:hypothetical protein BBJ28_00010971 [Nothophytophthora sp. Chile5]